MEFPVDRPTVEFTCWCEKFPKQYGPSYSLYSPCDLGEQLPCECHGSRWGCSRGDIETFTGELSLHIECNIPAGYIGIINGDCVKSQIISGNEDIVLYDKGAYLKKGDYIAEMYIVRADTLPTKIRDGNKDG